MGRASTRGFYTSGQLFRRGSQIDGLKQKMYTSGSSSVERERAVRPGSQKAGSIVIFLFYGICHVILEN